MNYDDLSLGEFLAARMKDKGFTLKKLSEATGIAPTHIENMMRGDLESLPSAPYFRGYLIRIGKTLDFDGAEWWKKVRGVGAVRNSGPTDALPQNRYVKSRVPTWVWFAIAGGILLIAYLTVALPRILGEPFIAVTYPSETPFVSSATTLTFLGTVRNADSLYLSSGGGVKGSSSSSEPIPVAPDGTWQKSVLLQNGLNTFDITAKKFLGGETNIMEQVIYEPPLPPASTTPGTAATSTP